jgi:hypothetical protein
MLSLRGVSRVTAAACFAVSIALGSSSSGAQQPTRPPRDTTAHPMPGMPGMPATPTHRDSSTRAPARARDTTARQRTDSSAMPTMSGMPAPNSSGTRGDSGMAMHSMGMHAGEMRGMSMMTPDPLGVSMDRMGSGTTWVPDAAPIPSRYRSAGRWDLTTHGFLFGQYTSQSGPRGGRQLGSLNWGMVMASHALAGGRFQARTMLSLDALGVTPRGYPLLLQTGEAYNGIPLHDRQHPHDLFMELGALYERPVTSRVGVSLYAAPSGEPALGPVAFMHRPSAMDNPLAPIGHHWQDATHISFGVLTAGLFTHSLKLEGSAFNGREPDQYRYDFEPIRLNSYSARLTYDPTSRWSLEAGYGRITSPEALQPDESMHRVTASVLHGIPLGTDGQWATTLLYGANARSTTHTVSHSVLLESEAVLDRRNTLLVRGELVQKSAEELALDGPSVAATADTRFDVGQLSLGYIRELARFDGATVGVGALGTVDLVPAALGTAYGSRTPRGAMLFLRLRPTPTRMSMAASTGMPARAR